MRRPAGRLAAVALLGLAACSGGSAVPAVHAGDPTASLSPAGPTPSPGTPRPPATVTEPTSPTGGAATSPDLPACLPGRWTAPLAREFDDLGIEGRTGGLVRGGTGTLDLRFTADHAWRLAYRGVRLALPAGSVGVDGQVAGTWSLAGDTLTADAAPGGTAVTVAAGGVSPAAPPPVTRLLAGLLAGPAHVACTGAGLQMQLPTTQGGGTVTLDAAPA